MASNQFLLQHFNNDSSGVNEVLAKLSSGETGAEQKRFENLQCVSKFIKTKMTVKCPSQDDIDQIQSVVSAINRLAKEHPHIKSHDAMLLVLEWHKNEKSCNISYLYEDILDTLVIITDLSDECKTHATKEFWSRLISIILSEFAMQIRVETVKTLNQLLQGCTIENRKSFVGIKAHNPLLKTLVSQLLSVGDYEMQVGMIETIFRLIPKKERAVSFKHLFSDDGLRKSLLTIADSKFETDCRKVLNAINACSKARNRVITMACLSVCVGKRQLEKPADEAYDKFWVDFNIGSKRLSVFCKNFSQDILDDTWDTLSVWDHKVSSYSCEEPENLVRIYLNSWVSDLLSPISSTGESIILIAFEPTAAGVKQALKDTFGVHKERVQMEDDSAPDISFSQRKSSIPDDKPVGANKSGRTENITSSRTGDVSNKNRESLATPQMKSATKRMKTPLQILQRNSPGGRSVISFCSTKASEPQDVLPLLQKFKQGESLGHKNLPGHLQNLQDDDLMIPSSVPDEKMNDPLSQLIPNFGQELKTKQDNCSVNKSNKADTSTLSKRRKGVSSGGKDDKLQTVTDTGRGCKQEEQKKCRNASKVNTLDISKDRLQNNKKIEAKDFNGLDKLAEKRQTRSRSKSANADKSFNKSSECGADSQDLFVALPAKRKKTDNKDTDSSKNKNHVSKNVKANDSFRSASIDKAKAQKVLPTKVTQATDKNNKEQVSSKSDSKETRLPASNCQKQAEEISAGIDTTAALSTSVKTKFFTSRYKQNAADSSQISNSSHELYAFHSDDDDIPTSKKKVNTTSSRTGKKRSTKKQATKTKELTTKQRAKSVRHKEELSLSEKLFDAMCKNTFSSAKSNPSTVGGHQTALNTSAALGNSSIEEARNEMKDRANRSSSYYIDRHEFSADSGKQLNTSKIIVDMQDKGSFSPAEAHVSFEGSVEDIEAGSFDIIGFQSKTKTNEIESISKPSAKTFKSKQGLTTCKPVNLDILKTSAFEHSFSKAPVHRNEVNGVNNSEVNGKGSGLTEQENNSKKDINKKKKKKVDDRENDVPEGSDAAILHRIASFDSLDKMELLVEPKKFSGTANNRFDNNSFNGGGKTSEFPRSILKTSNRSVESLGAENSISITASVATKENTLSRFKPFDKHRDSKDLVAKKASSKSLEKKCLLNLEAEETSNRNNSVKEPANKAIGGRKGKLPVLATVNTSPIAKASNKNNKASAPGRRYSLSTSCSEDSDEEREILSDPEEVMPPVAKFQSLCQTVMNKGGHAGRKRRLGKSVNYKEGSESDTTEEGNLQEQAKQLKVSVRGRKKKPVFSDSDNQTVYTDARSEASWLVSTSKRKQPPIRKYRKTLKTQKKVSNKKVPNKLAAKVISPSISSPDNMSALEDNDNNDDDDIELLRHEELEQSAKFVDNENSSPAFKHKWATLAETAKAFKLTVPTSAVSLSGDSLASGRVQRISSIQRPVIDLKIISTACKSNSRSNSAGAGALSGARGQLGSSVRPRKLFSVEQVHKLGILEAETDADDDDRRDLGTEDDDAATNGEKSDDDASANTQDNVALNISMMTSGYGKELMQSFTEQKRQIELFSKTATKSADQCFTKAFVCQREAREKILNNFSASLLSELDSLEQEVKDAKRDEDKIKTLFNEQLNVLRKRAANRSSRLKNIQTLSHSLHGELKAVEEEANRDQEDAKKSMKARVEAVQKKILQEMQQKELLSIRKMLQSLIG